MLPNSNKTHLLFSQLNMKFTFIILYNIQISSFPSTILIESSFINSNKNIYFTCGFNATKNPIITYLQEITKEVLIM